MCSESHASTCHFLVFSSCEGVVIDVEKSKNNAGQCEREKGFVFLDGTRVFARKERKNNPINPINWNIPVAAVHLNTFLLT